MYCNRIFMVTLTLTRRHTTLNRISWFLPASATGASGKDTRDDRFAAAAPDAELLKFRPPIVAPVALNCTTSNKKQMTNLTLVFEQDGFNMHEATVTLQYK